MSSDSIRLRSLASAVGAAAEAASLDENSEFDDGGSALSADGTTLYFYSTRPGGFGGRDLFVATRHRIEGEDREDDRRDDRVHRRGGS